MEHNFCKFVDRKIVQGKVHEFCINLDMLEINKKQPGEKLVCMGSKCGKALYDNTEILMKQINVAYKELKKYAV